MNRGAAQRVARMGLLFALALVLGILEGWVTPVLGLPPGVRLGLANTVVLYAELYLGRWPALVLVLLKALFALLVRGGMAGILSLCGGVLSFLVMLLMLLPRKKNTSGLQIIPTEGGDNCTKTASLGAYSSHKIEKASILLVSVAGAIAHNVGQVLVVWLWLGGFSLVYAPVLVLSGTAMGCLVALITKALLPSLQNAVPRQSAGNKNNTK